MAKSLRISTGETQVRYSPKVTEDTRGRLNALATVLRVGQRELLEKMLAIYEQ